MINLIGRRFTMLQSNQEEMSCVGTIKAFEVLIRKHVVQDKEMMSCQNQNKNQTLF